MTHKSAITPADLATLSEDASVRLYAWWTPDFADLVIDLDSGDIYPAGDSKINPCLEKGHNHYASCMPLLSTMQMIQYLDDHDLYRDPKTGMTHADGIAADQLCDWLWDRVAAHLEHADDPQPLPDFVAVVG